jgi:hypothetical protein
VRFGDGVLTACAALGDRRARRTGWGVERAWVRVPEAIDGLEQGAEVPWEVLDEPLTRFGVQGEPREFEDGRQELAGLRGVRRRALSHPLDDEVERLDAGPDGQRPQRRGWSFGRGARGARDLRGTCKLFACSPVAAP